MTLQEPYLSTCLLTDAMDAVAVYVVAADDHIFAVAVKVQPVVVVVVYLKERRHAKYGQNRLLCAFQRVASARKGAPGRRSPYFSSCNTGNVRDVLGQLTLLFWISPAWCP